MAKRDHSYMKSQLTDQDQDNIENVKDLEPHHVAENLTSQTNDIHIGTSSSTSIGIQDEINTGSDVSPITTGEKPKQNNKCTNVPATTDPIFDDEGDTKPVIVQVQLKDYNSLETVNSDGDYRKTAQGVISSYKDSENNNTTNNNNNNNGDKTQEEHHQQKHEISSLPQATQVETRRSYNTLHFFILFLCAAVMIVNKSILEPVLIILTILAEPYICYSNLDDEHPVTYESKYAEEEIREQCNKPENGSNIEETDPPNDFNETQDMVLELPTSGRTLLNWLSNEDLYKLKDLASTRLHSIFKSYEVDHKSKTHRKKKSLAGFQGVFKVDLDNLLQQDKHINIEVKNMIMNYENKTASHRISERKVPLVICKLIAHLEKHGLHEEGILRKAGNSAIIRQLLATLDEHFYSNPTLVDEALANASAHDVASVFKTLIRDLPIPLLTEMHMAAFYKTHKVPNLHERLLALTMLILQLPPTHRDTLYMVLELCFVVSSHEASNKMSLTNVATIMAPNLFQPQRSHNRSSMRRLSLSADKNQAITDEMVWTSETPALMGILIRNRELIWTVPHQLMTQLRTEYNTEANKQRNNIGNIQFRQLIWRKSRVESNKELSVEVNWEEVDFLNIIMPQFDTAEYKVNLSTDTTVKEVLIKVLGSENVHDSQNVDTQLPLGSQHNPSASSSMMGNPTTTLELCTRRPSLQNALLHHSLHECGGNIGERLLDPYAKLKAIYQENPTGTFVVKCHHFDNEDNAKDIIFNEDTCTLNDSSQDDSVKGSESVKLYPSHWNSCIQILISIPIYPSACALLAIFVAFYSIIWEYEVHT